jgi:predicted transcriptional regulator
MMKRTRFEIRTDILKVAKHGANKTHIVYGSYTNFFIINSYIKYLIDSGLLTKDRKRYYTTEKGLKYIEKVKAFLQLEKGYLPLQ